MEEYTLELKFLTDNKKWIEGFECGMLYGRMIENETPIENHFHNKNVEQIKLMAEKYSYQIEVTPKGDGWTKITLKKDVWDDFILLN